MDKCLHACAYFVLSCIARTKIVVRVKAPMPISIKKKKKKGLTAGGTKRHIILLQAHNRSRKINVMIVEELS